MTFRNRTYLYDLRTTISARSTSGMKQDFVLMVAGVKSSAEVDRSAPSRCRGAACIIATVGITNHLAVSLFLIFKSFIINSSSYLTLLFVRWPCWPWRIFSCLLTLRRVPEAPYNIGLIIPGLFDPGGRAIGGAGLQQFDCWDREFESRWGHESSSLVFVVCCVGSGLFD
jgi:hypothetical protein